MRSTALLLAALAGPACAQEEHRFDDWTAACRSDGYCSAKVGDYAGARNLLRIGRHAEEVYWEVSLTTLAEVADPAAAFTATVDAGDAVVFRGEPEVAAYGSRHDVFFTGKSALALMDKLPPGSGLALDYFDVGGTAARTAFSLAGLNAALIWIDGQQNRLGSERVAEAPPIGRLPVRALQDRIPPALLAQHEADTDCTSLAELGATGEITIDPGIGDGMTLYILPCWSAEHNDGSKAYISPYDGIFSDLALPEYAPEDGWTATTHLLNARYDAADQTLTAGYRGDAAGSCGTSGVWRWQPYGFRLLEFRSHPDCNDSSRDVSAFPLVWPQPAPAN